MTENRHFWCIIFFKMMYKGPIQQVIRYKQGVFKVFSSTRDMYGTKNPKRPTLGIFPHSEYEISEKNPVHNFFGFF